MTDPDNAHQHGEVSRRRFLRAAAALGTVGALELLPGCRAGSLEVSPSATAEPTTPPVLTPTSQPSPTPRPSPTPSPRPTDTPVPDVPLFDERELSRVFVAHDSEMRGYPVSPPFGPQESYPDLPYTQVELATSNDAYHLVREALRLMSPKGFGSASWNPLAAVIQPGDRVVIKPNLVDDSQWVNGQITHPAFLRPIIDYVYKACGPSGRILLAEGPWAAGVFDRLVANTGIQAMVEYLSSVHGVPVVLKDLNKATREATPLVDLGGASELRSVERVWYDAHGEAMHAQSDPGVGRYRIAPSILDADVVISVPKAKVHCSGGVTLAMKNMLGIIPAWDGAYEQAELKDCAHTNNVDRAGGSRGIYLDNDTIWRSMADLNRILLHADSHGVLQVERQRRYLAIVDGIVAAEESQYRPRPYSLNTVVVGGAPVTVDAVTARCMGFDPRLLKSVVRAAGQTRFPLGTADPARIKVTVSGGEGLSGLYRKALTPELHVFSWEGHVEANDFDPPRLVSRSWDAEGSQLTFVVRDPAGVAWARLAYDHNGERRLQALERVAGRTEEGRWSVHLPQSAGLARATLMVGDELFNETSLEVTW